MYGYTALDFCMGIKKNLSRENSVFYAQSDEDNSGSLNYAMAEVIFMGIKEYGFMHSSYQVTEALILATRLALPGVAEYLESRLIDVEHQFPVNTQRSIKWGRLRNCKALGDYGYLQTPVCCSEEVI